MVPLRALLSGSAALALVALLGGWCEALEIIDVANKPRVKTGDKLVPQGGQLFPLSAAGLEFPVWKFDTPTSPSGGPWTMDQCRLKALAICKQGTSLGIVLEINAICWVVAQAFSDFVDTSGGFGRRGSDSAVLPIVNQPATGGSPLYVFDVLTAEPSAQPSGRPSPLTTEPPSALKEDSTASPTKPTPADQTIIKLGAVGGVLFVSITGVVLAAWRFGPGRLSRAPPSAMAPTKTVGW